MAEYVRDKMGNDEVTPEFIAQVLADLKDVRIDDIPYAPNMIGSLMADAAKAIEALTKMVPA